MSENNQVVKLNDEELGELMSAMELFGNEEEFNKAMDEISNEVAQCTKS